MAVSWFPYEARPFQAEAAALVAATAKDGGHLVLEAPTGTGKTVLLLAGALEAALPTGRRVLYVTRTNSQQEQAVRELVAIQERAGRPLRAVALQGRRRLCLKLEDAADPEWKEASPEDLSHYCSHAKRLAETDSASTKACRYYAGLLDRSPDDLDALAGSRPITAEAFKRLGREGGFCSYEAAKRLLPEADVVVAPYVYAFDHGHRQRLLQLWGVTLDDIVLVVDEAHNLPGYLRELHSPRLGREPLRRALSESESLHHPAVARGMTTRALLEALAEIVDRVAAAFAQEEEGFVPPFEVEGELLDRFRLTTPALLQAADHVAHLGETVKDRRRLMGKIPRSALHAVALFLRRWVESDDEGYVKLVGREPRPFLEAHLVDASRAAAVLHEFHASIHASGTLSPLAEYRDTLGLGEGARLERFPSPFPPDRLTVVAARGLSTKFQEMRTDPTLADRLQEAARRFVERCRVNGAVFFPSHQLLEEFAELGVLQGGRGQLLVESRALDQERLMQMVHAHREAQGQSLLAGVLGGRLSEGLDFPGRQLEALCIVGAPYPKPTARQRALFHYHETRHGRGWEYAVHAPTVRRLRQAIGRLIRGPADRGFAIVLDERAAGLLETSGVPCQLLPLDEILAAFERWQKEPAPEGIK